MRDSWSSALNNVYRRMQEDRQINMTFKSWCSRIILAAPTLDGHEFTAFDTEDASSFHSHNNIERGWGGEMERKSAACQFILGTVEDKQCTAMHLYLHWYWIFYLSKIFTAPNFCAVTWCRIQASPRKCLRQVWYRCWYYCLLWVQIEKCDINLSWVNRGKVRNELLREIDIYVICHKSFQTMNCRHVNYQS